MNTGNNDYTNKSIKQKYLGNRGLLILTAFLSAFIPLSTDLYLPSLPLMTQSFHTTATLVNLTIILFFAFFALGTLFWGPLSDKYGRRKILLTGLVMYTASSILCAVSGNIYQLILFRVLQAVSSGASTAVGTAIVKDVYEGKKRESILAVVQSMAMVAPIIAPVIGALVLKVTSWRGVFWVLAILGLIAAIGGILLQETIRERYKGSTFRSLGQLAVVIKNPGFSSLLITFFLINIPYMAFITASSYIYVEGFGLSEQVFSYFFAFNASFALIGPLIYIRISSHLQKNSIIVSCFCIISLSGFMLLIFGSIKPWLFALLLMPATLSVGIMRPPSVNLMLEQQKENIGAASSLMGFVNTFFGCIGMLLISLGSGSRIIIIGIMYAVTALSGLILWRFFHKKPFIKQV